MLRKTSLQKKLYIPYQGIQYINDTSEENLSSTAIRAAERRKQMRYHGSRFIFDYSIDRWWFYMHTGGPRTAKMHIDPKNRRKQYHHKFETYNEYNVKPVMSKAMWRFQHCSQYYQQSWDCRVMHSNALDDGMFRTWGRGWALNDAIKLCEEMGLKYSITDPLSEQGFRLENNMYFKHRLYSHNFPWVEEPELGRNKGDPDHLWKGRDTYDYSAFTAEDRARDSFVSIWDKTKETFGGSAPTAVHPQAEAPAKPKAAPAAAEKPKKAAAAPKEDKPKAAAEEKPVEKAEKKAAAAEKPAKKEKAAAAEEKPAEKKAPKEDKPKAAAEEKPSKAEKAEKKAASAKEDKKAAAAAEEKPSKKADKKSDKKPESK